MSYRYYIYGLHVESEIELPEAYVDPCIELNLNTDKEDGNSGASQEYKPDLRIVYGRLPEEVLALNQDKTDQDFFISTSKNAMAFRVAGIADYLVEENQITIRSICGEENASDIRCYLLGSACGYCMQLKHKVLLHGGATASGEHGVIVTGESGAGKSTVSNGLRQRGYQFIADDVCALAANGKKMHINLAYPQQKLCRDAALAMGYNLEDLIYINESRDKFAVRLKEGFLPEGRDFDYLFELVLSDSENLEFRKVTGQEKLSLLIRNIFRGEEGFYFWGLPPEYMKQCLMIASTIEVYQIARPKDLDTLPAILDFIDSKVNS